MFTDKQIEKMTEDEVLEALDLVAKQSDPVTGRLSEEDRDCAERLRDAWNKKVFSDEPNLA